MNEIPPPTDPTDYVVLKIPRRRLIAHGLTGVATLTGVFSIGSSCNTTAIDVEIRKFEGFARDKPGAIDSDFLSTLERLYSDRRNSVGIAGLSLIASIMAAVMGHFIGTRDY